MKRTMGKISFLKTMFLAFITIGALMLFIGCQDDSLGVDNRFYVSYDTKNLNLTLGQQKVFQSLDDLCSDLNTSFLERAAFTQAFNFSRRTGLTATYKKDAFVFQAGVTTDSLVQLNDVKDNSLGVDGRAVWAPKMGNTQFHLAGSVHWRDRNDFADVTTRYRARPYVRTTDTRFVSTPQLYVDQELSYGVEAAAK